MHGARGGEVLSEINVYVANLGKYNEGELVGAWFTPPLDYDEIAEQIGLNEQYEEFAIHDYEAPFEIGEYTSISEINRMYYLYEDLTSAGLEDVIGELIAESGWGLEELADRKDDIIHYPDCNDITDIAYYLVDEIGMLDGMPDNVSRYFDYAAFGRDLDMEGTYISTSRGMYELPM